MSFVIPVALQIHFFSKNKNDAGYMQEPNRTLLNNNKKIPFFYIWLGFFTYTGLMALIIQFIVLPYIFPSWHAGNGLLKGLDCTWFHEVAVKLAQKIHAQGWSAWELRPLGQAQVGIAGAIYAISVPKLWTTIPLNAALHATAALVLFKILLIFIPRWRIAILFVLPFLMYPTASTWYSQNHKDGYSIAGAFLFVYGWLLFARLDTWQRSWRQPCKSILLIISGVALCRIVRPYQVDLLQGAGILLALFMTGTYMVWVKKHHLPWHRASLSTLLVWTIVCAMNPWIYPEITVFIDNRVKSRIESMKIDRKLKTSDIELKTSDRELKTSDRELKTGRGEVKMKTRPLIEFIKNKLIGLIEYRAIYFQAYPHAKSNLDPLVRLRGIRDLLFYTPRAAQIAFLSPFPSMWLEQGSSEQTTLMRRIAAFEMIIVYISLLGIPLAILCFYRRSEFWVILIFCSSIMLVYGLLIPNAGTLYRNRYGFIMMLVAIGLMGLYAFWQELQKKRQPTHPMHSAGDSNKI